MVSTRAAVAEGKVVAAEVDHRQQRAEDGDRGGKQLPRVEQAQPQRRVKLVAQRHQDAVDLRQPDVGAAGPRNSPWRWQRRSVRAAAGRFHSPTPRRASIPAGLRTRRWPVRPCGQAAAHIPIPPWRGSSACRAAWPGHGGSCSPPPPDASRRCVSSIRARGASVRVSDAARRSAIGSGRPDRPSSQSALIPSAAAQSAASWAFGSRVAGLQQRRDGGAVHPRRPGQRGLASPCAPPSPRPGGRGTGRRASRLSIFSIMCCILPNSC